MTCFSGFYVSRTPFETGGKLLCCRTTLGQQHLFFSLQGCIVEERRDDDEEEHTFPKVQQHRAVSPAACGFGLSVLLLLWVLKRDDEQILTDAGVHLDDKRAGPSALLHLFRGFWSAACGPCFDSTAHFLIKPRINCSE